MAVVVKYGRDKSLILYCQLYRSKLAGSFRGGCMKFRDSPIKSILNIRDLIMNMYKFQGLALANQLKTLCFLVSFLFINRY